MLEGDCKGHGSWERSGKGGVWLTQGGARESESRENVLHDGHVCPQVFDDDDACGVQMLVEAVA